ncbi:hypothetical protein AB4Y35_07405 [Paraburkholderia sp. EG286A]|uniref:hypothetical protein n=1 Tax=Paraburkholderia sp. EG286A TaxID=3237014 RepID=UPI0034D195EA
MASIPAIAWISDDTARRVDELLPMYGGVRERLLGTLIEKGLTVHSRGAPRDTVMKAATVTRKASRED